MDWKTVKLGDVCTKIGSGATPSGGKDAYKGGDYSLVRSQNVLDLSFSVDGLVHIDGEQANKLSNVALNEGDVLLNITGDSVARSCMLPNAILPARVNQHVSIIRTDRETLDNYYLLYYLQVLKPQLLSIASAGATRNALTKGMLEHLEIKMPPLTDQRKIASILSSLDAQIENNNRINRNLEEQAQALFKSWFVDFEPWGGTMPADWKEGVLGDYCESVLGGTPSRDKAEYWNGSIAWINSGEVNRFRITSPSEWITELGVQKSATKLLPAKTTVLAITGATLGQVSLLEIDTCANQSVIGILQNDRVPYEYIYPLINFKIKELILNQTGGAQQHINKNNVESLPIIMPSAEILQKYKSATAPIYSIIAKNEFESTRLAALRDTLLPKLMKGEIEI